MKRYELTKEQWEHIKELLPPETAGMRGRPRKDDRNMLNGMLWTARSGAQWREMPEAYGPWQPVYARFAKWRDGGTLEAIFRALSADADMENLSLDSTCIKVHESANGGGKTADKAVGRTRGGLNTKLHAAVDGLGNPVEFMLTAGNGHDSVHAVELLKKVESSNVLADRAYGAKAIRAYISEQGMCIVPDRLTLRGRRPVPLPAAENQGQGRLRRARRFCRKSPAFGQVFQCGTNATGRSRLSSSRQATRPVITSPSSVTKRSFPPPSITKTGAGSTGIFFPAFVLIQSISCPHPRQMLIRNAPVPLWPPAPATTPDYSGTPHSGKRCNLRRRTPRNTAFGKPDPTGLLLRAIPEGRPPTPAGFS